VPANRLPLYPFGDGGRFWYFYFDNIRAKVKENSI
jgi:hypothetical protein